MQLRSCGTHRNEVLNHELENTIWHFHVISDERESHAPGGKWIPDGYGRYGPNVDDHHRDGEIGRSQERLNFSQPGSAWQKKTHRVTAMGFFIKEESTPKAKCLTRHMKGAARARRPANANELSIDTSHAFNQACVHWHLFACHNFATRN